MSEPDPFMRQIREAISDNDRTLVDAVNKRLELVARLKAYKEAQGIDFLDPEREEWMKRLQELTAPLTPEGLSEFYIQVLALTKREVNERR